MFRKSRVAVAAVSVVGLGLAMAGTASASSDGHGDQQTIGQTHCNSSVSGGNPGGRISTTVSGSETRVEGGYFRTSWVVTQYDVYKSVDGTWYPYSQSKTHTAILGAGHVQGGMVVANWKYKKAPFNDPRYGTQVTTSGTYYVAVTSALYNQDGINFYTLVDNSAVCNFKD